MGRAQLGWGRGVGTKSLEGAKVKTEEERPDQTPYQQFLQGKPNWGQQDESVLGRPNRTMRRKHKRRGRRQKKTGSYT